MERVVTVVPESGLHARPASKFVQTANQFDADLSIAPCDGDSDPKNARSILAVTGMSVRSSEKVRLIAEGKDAKAALDALENVLSTPENGDHGC
jgi:phosphocarrier protein